MVLLEAASRAPLPNQTYCGLRFAAMKVRGPTQGSERDPNLANQKRNPLCPE
jgi:hypothetical protein